MIPTALIKQGLKIALKIVAKEAAQELAKQGVNDIRGKKN